jgi:hypothetical protein
MSMDMETTSMHVERDGQPIEASGGMSSSTKREIAWTDKVLEHKDGAPTKVRRAFGDLKQSSAYTFGENENTSERDGSLNGVTLELTRGDDDKVEAKAVEGDAPGEALVGHQLTLPLDAFLPDKEVAADDGWELDAAAIKRGLGIDLTNVLFPPPAEEPSSGGDSGGRRRGGRGFGGGTSMLLSNDKWEGKATLSDAKEDFEGAACHVIKIELSSDGQLEEPSSGGGRGRAFGVEAAAFFETTYEVKLEGRLLFDAKTKLPVHLVLEGKAKIDSRREFERDGVTSKFESTQEGDVKFEATASVE